MKKEILEEVRALMYYTFYKYLWDVCCTDAEIYFTSLLILFIYPHVHSNCLSNYNLKVAI